MKSVYFFVFLFALVLAMPEISAQQNERDRRIELFNKGNNAEAVSELEKASKQKEFGADAETFNYLGLAYLNADNSKKARKALEKAVKLRPENSVYHSNLAYTYLLVRHIEKSQVQAETALRLDPSNAFAYYIIGLADLWEGKLDDALSASEKILSTNPAFPQAYMLKSDVLIAKLGRNVATGSKIKDEGDLLRQSVEVLETGVRNSQKHVNLKAIEEKLEPIKVFYEYFNKGRTAKLPVAGTPEPVVKPRKILRKPPAVYTENARQAGVTGTIRLALLLEADGKIRHILKLWELGYGLDEQALIAARKIEFEPHLRDGKPVSVVQFVEYRFNYR